MRTMAREADFQYVFASRFGGAGVSLKKSLYKNHKLTSDDIAYCDKILSIINEHEQEFVSIIDSYSTSFPESRLFPADRSIMFIALAETLYMDDIPPAVSLNEAANIASKYSTEKSATFISGILAEVIKG